MKKTNLLQRVCSLVIIVSLFIQQSGFAQVAGEVNIAGYLSGMMSNLAQDKFRPMHLRYLQYLPAENSFKLLVDKGDFLGKQSIANSPLSIDKTKPHEPANTRTHELNRETKKLMEYFAVGLRLSNESFWVNLRLDSPDNVIDDYLAQTDVGRIMLESDGQLKKDVSLMTSPETTQGKIYWDRLYKKAEELFGYENVTIPTLTRPWIVPGEVIISETADSAYIYKATLKVMLEEDYLKKQSIEETQELKNSRTQELNTYSTQLIKELIIPKLTQEVNSSKRYAELRQVYYSLIMAQWFKQRFCAESIVDSPLSIEKEKNDYINLINSGNLTGLTSKQAWNKQTYFEQYQKSFKHGEYNVKQTVSTPTGQVIRSYFSGGEKFDLGVMQMGEKRGDGVASPIMVSLPAVSSAVSYNPEQMAAIKVSGELDVVNNMGEQDSGLLGQRTVSSSMEQQDEIPNIVKYIAIVLIGTAIGTLLYKPLVMEPANKSAQERINVLAESASYGNDEAIDELGLKIDQDEIGAQAAADKLENLALDGKDRAFKVLANSAGNGSKIALNAIISLAHREYGPAKGWLRNIDPSSISSLTPNPLASKVLALIKQGLTVNTAEAGTYINVYIEVTNDLLQALRRAYKEKIDSKDKFIDKQLEIILSVPEVIRTEQTFLKKEDKETVTIGKMTTKELIDIYQKIGFEIISQHSNFKKEEVRYLCVLADNPDGTKLVFPIQKVRELEDDNFRETLQIAKKYQNAVRDARYARDQVLSINPKDSAGRKHYSEAISIARKEKKQAGEKNMEALCVKARGFLISIELQKGEEQPQSFNNGNGDIQESNKTVSSSLKNEKEIIETIVVGLRLIIEGEMISAGTRINKVIPGATIPDKIVHGKVIKGETIPGIEVDYTTSDIWYQHDASRIANEIQMILYSENPNTFYNDKVKTQDINKALMWYNDNFNSSKINQAKAEIIAKIKDAKAETERRRNRLESLQKKFPEGSVDTSRCDKQIEDYNRVIEIITNFDTYIAVLANRSLPKSSSSIANTPLGGIDFTIAYPIVNRAVSNLSIGAGGVSMDRLLGVNLGQEWQEIERMASSGVRVSSERLKEYVQASCAQDVVSMDKVLLCISDRLKQEEESCLPSEQLVIDMLAVFLSTSSQAQLRAVFIGN